MFELWFCLIMAGFFFLARAPFGSIDVSHTLREQSRTQTIYYGGVRLGENAGSFRAPTCPGATSELDRCENCRNCLAIFDYHYNCYGNNQNISYYRNWSRSIIDLLRSRSKIMLNPRRYNRSASSLPCLNIFFSLHSFLLLFLRTGIFLLFRLEVEGANKTKSKTLEDAIVVSRPDLFPQDPPPVSEGLETLHDVAIPLYGTPPVRSWLSEPPPSEPPEVRWRPDVTGRVGPSMFGIPLGATSPIRRHLRNSNLLVPHFAVRQDRFYDRFYKEILIPHPQFPYEEGRVDVTSNQVRRWWSLDCPFHVLNPLRSFRNSTDYFVEVGGYLGDCCVAAYWPGWAKKGAMNIDVSRFAHVAMRRTAEAYQQHLQHGNGTEAGAGAQTPGVDSSITGETRPSVSERAPGEHGPTAQETTVGKGNASANSGESHMWLRELPSRSRSLKQVVPPATFALGGANVFLGDVDGRKRMVCGDDSARQFHSGHPNSVRVVSDAEKAGKACRWEPCSDSTAPTGSSSCSQVSSSLDYLLFAEQEFEITSSLFAPPEQELETTTSSRVFTGPRALVLTAGATSEQGPPPNNSPLPTVGLRIKSTGSYWTHHMLGNSQLTMGALRWVSLEDVCGCSLNFEPQIAKVIPCYAQILALLANNDMRIIELSLRYPQASSVRGKTTFFHPGLVTRAHYERCFADEPTGCCVAMIVAARAGPQQHLFAAHEDEIMSRPGINMLCTACLCGNGGGTAPARGQ